MKKKKNKITVEIFNDVKIRRGRDWKNRNFMGVTGIGIYRRRVQRTVIRHPQRFQGN